jgi:hypothetical protein
MWIITISVLLALTSSFNHKCNTDPALGIICGSWCARDEELLLTGDEIFAGLLYHSVTLFDWWPAKYEHRETALTYVLMTTAIIPVITVLLEGMDNPRSYVLIGISILNIVMRIILPDPYKLEHDCFLASNRCAKDNKAFWAFFDACQEVFPLSTIWSWLFLLLAVPFGIIAYLMDYSSVFPGTYGQTHTLWHFFGASAAFLFILAVFKRNRKPPTIINVKGMVDTSKMQPTQYFQPYNRVPGR